MDYYESPLGKIFLAADDDGLTGLWFDSDRYLPKISASTSQKNLPVIEEAKRWLDIYFSGREPNFTPPLHMIGTEFRIDVWNILRQVPYGQTITYGAVAKILARKKFLAKMSARAVGGAVGHNDISIIIPCHRVVGTNGNLVGYGGGLDKKIKLLKLEGVDVEKFSVPKKRYSA